MDHNSKRTILENYNKSAGHRRVVSCLRCFFRKNFAAVRANYFRGKWLAVSESDLPDEINFENLQYSMLNRRLR